MNRLLTATAVTAVIALSGTAAATAAPSDVTGRDNGHSHSKGGHVASSKYTSAKGMPSPLVVAHRGASGYRPEHTLAAYELAAAVGADFIEPDLVLTKDGVLVDRHEPEISGTTDVASRPEFAARKTTKNLDGTPVTGWFTEDFTLAELKTLRAKERLADVRQENTIYDGRYEVPTYEEVLQLREELSKKHRRTIGVIPEIKHSTYFHAQGHNPEKPFVALTSEYGLNKRTAPMWLQSFELTNLKAVRTLGYKANSTFLTSSGAPYDLASTGDKRTYQDLLTPAGLRGISRFIDGIGPEKTQVIPRKADGTLGTPTSLVSDAHRVGLKVMPWTFRNENQFMSTDLRNGTNPADYGKAVEEIAIYLETGIDGVFTDNPDTGVEAREQFWAKH